MNIKLIGGSGFIGSRVYEYLKQKNYNIEVIDISDSHNNNGYIYCDIVTEPDKLNQLLKDADVVYMFAAISEATKNTEDPKLAVNTNILGLHNVLDACLKNNIKRIIFSSTSWVYSDCSEEVVDEDVLLNINSGSSIYTTTKITGEMLIKSYQRCFNLNYTILRYGTIYGENANPRTVISTFLKRARVGENITISSEGYRNFIHVDDIARTTASIVDYLNETVNETINIDGLASYRLEDIANIIKEIYPEVNIVKNVNDILEYKGKSVKTNKSERLINFKQLVKLEDWIKLQLTDEI
jgi:UDP-glucose 4-epimerase